MNSPPSFGIQGAASLLSSFTALVDRGRTLERVVTGKQKHGAKVAVRLTEVEQSKHSEQADHDSWLTYTAHSSPPPKPGHTHQSRRTFCSTPDFINKTQLSQVSTAGPTIQAGILLQMLPLSNELSTKSILSLPLT